jgi:PAS domain S-box-containing protein
MAEPRQILIVEDSPDDADLTVRALRRGGLELVYARVDTADAMRSALQDHPWDIVVADYSMPLFSGLEALAMTKHHNPDLPFILVSGRAGEDAAVQAMKAGAQDYFLKGRLDRLALAVERELGEAETRRERRRAEDRYRNLFNQVPVGLYSVTADGHTLDANPAFIEMLGFKDLAEFRDEDLRTFWKPEELAQLTEILVRDGVVRDFEFEGHRRDESILWGLNSLRAIFDTSGKIDHYGGVVVDITERKHAELELARSNQDLAHFANVASHDLREPLRMVSGFCDLFARKYRGKIDAAADEYISFMLDGVRRMEKLIQSLLLYSKVGKNSHPTTVDLNIVADSVLKNLSAAITDCSAVVTRGPMPRVWGDEAALFGLLLNLIANALKFSGTRTPEVRIEASESLSAWTISVIDNGIGIEPAYFDSVFEMFRRLGSQSEYPGSGIGLAICKRVVEQHHGKIWVESEPGAGSTFRFTLPRHTAEETQILDGSGSQEHPDTPR